MSALPSSTSRALILSGPPRFLLHILVTSVLDNAEDEDDFFHFLKHFDDFLEHFDDSYYDHDHLSVASLKDFIISFFVKAFDTFCSAMLASLVRVLFFKMIRALNSGGRGTEFMMQRTTHLSLQWSLAYFTVGLLIAMQPGGIWTSTTFALGLGIMIIKMSAIMMELVNRGRDQRLMDCKSEDHRVEALCGLFG